MRGSFHFRAISVLVIVAGLITIGLGAYRVKLEWLSPHEPQQPIREIPADLNKLTTAEIISLEKSIQDKMAFDKDILRQKIEFNSQKNLVNIFMTAGLIILFILLIVKIRNENKNLDNTNK